jgi:metallo-beta-lactamase class B
MAKELIEPIKITDDLFWVGVDSSSPAHLLVTDEGLVLIDTASHTNVDILIENIKSLGFDVRDVKHIIHSHGHFDHVGATTKIVSLSGAKTYIGARDADAVMGKNKRLWAGLALPENENDFYFVPDVMLRDGDVVKIGQHEFRFLETPGHTLGVLSIFWNVHYKGKEYLAGMFGGAGVNALTLPYIYYNERTEDPTHQMLSSIEKIWDEPVFVHLGNHPGNNKTLQKREQQLKEGGNPFIAPDSWHTFLSELKAKTEKIIEDNENLEKEISLVCEA